MKRFLFSAALGSLLFVFPLSAATITVAKSGADYSTITAAIKAAKPGDVIKIMDAATYEEQVTFDSSKYQLTLTSKEPASLSKPRIKFQDRVNVGPKTSAESNVDSLITFDQNGALRIMRTRNIIIDGIAVEGGGVFPFGFPSIWEGRYGLQHGNAAIVLYEAGGAIIRNCDISNAYFGISVKDRNLGGIFSNPNPADLDTQLTVPFSGYGKTGNHLVERCRIHNNSWGIFFESAWDLGTTIRYNLIYENHHPSEAVATQVYNLTSDEGALQCGGAFFFKDILLSPVAIYNNTFYHNFALLCGHWQAGYHHLVFNNIFGPPYKYWENASPAFRLVPMELSPVLNYRVYNCIFSAQYKAPQPNGIYLFDTVIAFQGSGGVVPDPGTVIAGIAGSRPSYPAAANNRWLELDSSLFVSLNPASADYLEPNWSNEIVKSYIVQQGWEKSGVKNTDGTRADLGAIEQAHGTPSFTGTIAPYPLPVILNGSSAQITFTLNEREGSAMSDPKIKLFRLVRTKYIKGSFGNTEKTLGLSASDMTDLTPPTTPPVKVGPNSYSVSANITGDFALIELIIEATGADGKQFTTSAGFIPYRKVDYIFKVEVLDKPGSKAITEARVGDTVRLRLTPQKNDGTVFTNTVNFVAVSLVSGFRLLDASKNPPDQLNLLTGVTGATERLVIFTKVPEGGIEFVDASGSYRNSSYSILPFIGGTAIKVLPDPTKIAPDKQSRLVKSDRALRNEVTATSFDLQGRRIFQQTLFSDMDAAFTPLYLQKKIPGMASKVYMLEIRVKDLVSLKQTRKVQKIVAP
jgi:hypothetical protein